MLIQPMVRRLHSRGLDCPFVQHFQPPLYWMLARSPSLDRALISLAIKNLETGPVAPQLSSLFPILCIVISPFSKSQASPLTDLVFRRRLFLD